MRRETESGLQKSARVRQEGGGTSVNMKAEDFHGERNKTKKENSRVGHMVHLLIQQN